MQRAVVLVAMVDRLSIVARSSTSTIAETKSTSGIQLGGVLYSRSTFFLGTLSLFFSPYSHFQIPLFKSTTVPNNSFFRISKSVFSIHYFTLRILYCHIYRLFRDTLWTYTIKGYLPWYEQMKNRYTWSVVYFRLFLWPLCFYSHWDTNMAFFVLCPACNEEHNVEDVEFLNVEENHMGQDVMTFRCNLSDTVQKSNVYGSPYN